MFTYSVDVRVALKLKVLLAGCGLILGNEHYWQKMKRGLKFPDREKRKI